MKKILITLFVCLPAISQNDMGRFEKATKNLSELDQDKFFRKNFETLMGSAF